ncbi:unknown protein [Seminavis robusta]|uniref:Uncharacterized protein n=1 Tax=Seminavis robusta TaxID=568900 RepID=A0A9N8DDA0_9STRA|nr:unknown protein [Seminavis robusta]|eukprot:Sro21_g015000.1 n/a (572) ;mRNA; r:162678-164393
MFWIIVHVLPVLLTLLLSIAAATALIKQPPADPGCLISLVFADRDRNEWLNRDSEFVAFVERMTNAQYYGDFDSLPQAFQRFYDKYANHGGEINIAGSIPGRPATGDQQDFLDAFCAEAMLLADGLTLAPTVAPSSYQLAPTEWRPLGGPLAIVEQEDVAPYREGIRILSMDATATRLAVSQTGDRIEIYERNDVTTSINGNNTIRTLEQPAVWNLTASVTGHPVDDRMEFVDFCLSSDGTTLICATVQQPSQNQVLVFSLSNHGEWEEVFRTPHPFFNRTTTNPDEKYPPREVVAFATGLTSTVVVSKDGSRLAFPVRISQWNGHEWDLTEENGVRVYEWNGTDYHLMGDTLVIGNPRPVVASLEMDDSGSIIHACGQRFEYNSDMQQWILTEKNVPPDSVLSPDGSRVAQRSERHPSEPGGVLIYQHNNNQTTGSPATWTLIAEIEAPYPEQQHYDYDDHALVFASSMDWSVDGTTLIIGAPNDERRPHDAHIASGSVYVFDAVACDDSINGDCAFVQAGDIPRVGTKNGRHVAIAADGNTILHTAELESGWRVMTYERGATSSSNTER